MKTAGGDILDLDPPETGHHQGADDGSGDAGFWEYKEGQFTRGGRGLELTREGMARPIGRPALVPFRVGSFVAQAMRVEARFPTPVFIHGGEQAA
ncbi:MAG TPA: hypothetical protein VLF59_03645 [Candidatus Saccharimonadales bacterium]|nr:hypothetical protein [Candidatus Saccharimonadales bacterium]